MKKLILVVLFLSSCTTSHKQIDLNKFEIVCAAEKKFKCYKRAKELCDKFGLNKVAEEVEKISSVDAVAKKNLYDSKKKGYNRMVISCVDAKK